MGIIKNGTVSGVTPETIHFAVDYPGYPSSIDRAVETLGGQEGMSKARSSKSNYLELRFRPEDPNCHPTFGELHHSNSLLLRISKKKTKQYGEAVGGNPYPDPQTEKAEDLRADIVAKIDDTYKFEGMVDFQFILAVHAHEKRKQKKKHENLQFEKSNFLEGSHDDLMMLLPPLFSLKDIPEQLVLKPSQVIMAKQRQGKHVQRPWEMNITPCFGVDFKTDEIPQKINWEDKITRDSEEWIVQTTISEYFEDRPIWQKRTLFEKLKDDSFDIGYEQFKRALFRTAYYFGAGPYRTLWIRNGYDARKDPESRIYQRIDFRVPLPLRHIIDAGTKQNDVVSWKDICCFRVVPHKKFSSLQLCDLQDDFIQDLIKKPVERTMCGQTTGWFSRSTFDILRLRVRLRFISLLPGEAAKELAKLDKKALQRYKNNFEIRNYGSNSDEGDIAAQPEAGSVPCNNITQGANDASNVNKDTASAPVEKDSMVVEDDNEAEDEEENYQYVDGDEKDEADDDESEEEEDEEMDEFDYPHMDGQHFNYGSFGYSHTQSNDDKSKNYLQQLLGKFPFEKDIKAGKLGGDDVSDGEYAIYEQDSDYEDDD